MLWSADPIYSYLITRHENVTYLKSLRHRHDLFS